MESDRSWRAHWRFYTGIGLYAASLAALAIEFPPVAWPLVVVPGALALGAYAVTGHRIALIALIVVMLGLFVAAALFALALQYYLLLPVSAGQILAVALLDRSGRDEPQASMA